MKIQLIDCLLVVVAFCATSLSAAKLESYYEVNNGSIVPPTIVFNLPVDGIKIDPKQIKPKQIKPKQIMPKQIMPKQSDSCSLCGQRKTSKNDLERIVGGVEAGVNEFNWRCAMFYYDNGYRFFCGCSIMNTKYILTAAHCTDAVKGRQIYIDSGDHDFSDSDESEIQLIPVKTVSQHPQYSSKTLQNDISVLELNKDLVFNKYVGPICLPYKLKNYQYANDVVVASGWGTEKEGAKSSPSKLRMVKLPMMPTAECKKYFKAGQITDSMTCTYEQGKDTCQGDSGGSIDYLNPSTGRYVAAGIVSFGNGCARRNSPGVYTKVDQHLDYIEKVSDGNFCKN